MPIDVTCPGCQKSFRVSDQFAGKQGPCPQCKTVITIPEKKPEVVIHAPETTGPKTSTGQPVLKPIRRVETKITRLQLGIIIGISVAALLGALVLRAVFGAALPWYVVGFGAVLMAPPIVFAGYTFLRDQELEPYRGTSIIIRTAILSFVYALLWGLYGWVPYLMGLERGEIQPIHLTFIVPVMIGIGAFAAFASLDLDFGSGAMHYGFYLIVTVLLCFVAGWKLWENPEAGGTSPRPAVPQVQRS
jgi:hypothetical protein